MVVSVELCEVHLISVCVLERSTMVESSDRLRVGEVAWTIFLNGALHKESLSDKLSALEKVVKFGRLCMNPFLIFFLVKEPCRGDV